MPNRLPQTEVKSDVVRVRISPAEAAAMRRVGDNASKTIRDALSWYLSHPAMQQTSEKPQ